MNSKNYNRIYILLLWMVLGYIPHGYSQNFSWEEVGSGIWKGTIGKPEGYDLLVASGAAPRWEGLKEMGGAEFPLSQEALEAEIADGKTRLRFPLEREEQIFGFGLNFKTIHQRGQILKLHVDHYTGTDNGRTHAPTPFYVSSNGYGVFVNSARYIDVYAGSAARRDSKNPPIARDRNTDKNWTSRPYSDAVEMLVPAEGVEVYIFAGPTPLEAVRRYNLFTGGGPLPPRWGLGFTQRVHKLYSADQVKEEVKLFEEKGYPLDFIGLEPGWQSKAYPNTFDWDRGRFPDPKQFVQELLDKGVRTNLWVNPYISPESSIYKNIFPYTASHTVWVGAVPDLSHAKAAGIFWKKFEDAHVDIGVSGYKIDEVDGYDRYLWPDVTIFPSGTSAEQMRQTYGLLVQKQSAALFRNRNQRTFGLVRASNGGGTRFPYVIYNDYYNHQDFITALINSGFAGVLWTPEARASKSAEEWIRRIQTTVFSPMAMINAWSSGTKPWTYEEVADEVKEMAHLRMRMMPYWYTAFAHYHYRGIPPFRAMNLEDGFLADQPAALTLSDDQVDLEKNPYAEAVRKEVKDQYMAGEFLLVAPMFTGQTSRQVVLPRGKWFDFYSGDYVGDGEVITVEPGLDKIPVFVKDGGIIPLMEPKLHAPKAGEKVNIEIRHYGEKSSSYLLYDDDGETFDYERGEYSWRKIVVQKDREGDWSGIIDQAPKGKPNSIGKVSWKFMTNDN